MKNLVILFGGQSVEHEVSLISAKNIMLNIDQKKYRIFPVGITKEGEFLLFKTNNCFLNDLYLEKICLNISNSEPVVFLPGNNSELLNLNNKIRYKIDLAFPVLHGQIGEDGTVQGVLKLANIPFVGSDLLGSAVGMDKDITKRLLREARIPTANFFTFCMYEKKEISFEKISKTLRLPLFVKPANTGSSVGINKVYNKEELTQAIEEAFKYDKKIIIEEGIDGRELECSVLGNESPLVSLPGEIVPHDTFYSYEAKYLKKNGADLIVPVNLPAEITKKVQDISKKTFKILNCEGMARVDGFLTPDNNYFINEVNTIPGFTDISMYPKLWEATGISYGDLIEKLLQLALQRQKHELGLKTSYS